MPRSPSTIIGVGFCGPQYARDERRTIIATKDVRSPRVAIWVDALDPQDMMLTNNIRVGYADAAAAR